MNDEILFVSKNGNSVRGTHHLLIRALTNISTALNRHITFALNNKNIYYTNFAASVIENNQTAIFEYISVNKPYVIRYKKQQLVLLAVRDNITGIHALLQRQLTGAFRRIHESLVNETVSS